MKERDRLKAIGGLLSSEKDKRKEKRQAKIKAKVKMKVQKKVEKIKNEILSVLEKFKHVRTDIESFNPRMVPLQPHTKQKWINDLNESIGRLENITFDKKKG